MSSFEFWYHHSAVSVPDLEALIGWNHAVLGFVLARRFRIESIPAHVAVLRNGPMHVELSQALEADPLPRGRRVPDRDILTHGNKHSAFAVNDVFIFSEELRRRGADVVSVTRFPMARPTAL